MSVVDDILKQAGAERRLREPEPERLPVRSRFLDRTADPTPEMRGARPVGIVTFLFWQVSPYLMGAVMMLLLLNWWAHERRRGLLAEIGAQTCATMSQMNEPEYAYMWLRPDPDSNVPRLREDQARACLSAYLF